MRRSGLTLIEVMIAMAILIVVSASAMLIFRGITRAWRTGELRTARYQQARLLLDLFNREIASCIRSAKYPLVGTNGDDVPSLQAGSAAHELFFVGTLPGRAGLVERGYWLSANGRLMCHDEMPADGDYATGLSELCGQDVQGLALSYFDGATWVESWDARPGAAQAGRLPRAVHVELTIGKRKQESFKTVVYVPTS